MKRPPRRARPSLGLRLAFKTASSLMALAWAPQRVAASFVGAAGRVTEVPAFGSNPGALKMFVFVPLGRLAPAAPVIVVLHGCGQDAAGFAQNAGWLALAQTIGAIVVMPQQSADNNRGRCFNWYRMSDTRRGHGEAHSIRQMIRTAVARFGSGRPRIYVAGLSAGGAMAVALLAAYPAVFTAGAVVAGVALGTASGPLEALSRLRHAETGRSRQRLGDIVRAAAPPSRTRTWPRLSIWQGTGDRTVDPVHAEILAEQWVAVNSLDVMPTTDETPLPGVRRRRWSAARRTPVELWTLDHMAHGFPVDAKVPGGGRPGPWVLDAGVPAAIEIARFWGLLGAGA